MWDCWNEGLLEAAASSPLLPFQELAECDFSVHESALGRSGSLSWGLYWPGLHSAYLREPVATLVLAVWMGKQCCKLSQSSGKRRLQRLHLSVSGKLSQ